MMTVELRAEPELKRVIKTAFPDYRKRAAFVSTFNGDLNINSYWDGGSRDVFALVELATGRTHALPTTSHPYFDIAARGLTNVESAAVKTDHVGNVYLTQLPPGFALVRSGTFCGKPATAHVYFNAADITPRLMSGNP